MHQHKSLERQHQNSRWNYVNGKSNILVLPNAHLDAKNARGRGDVFSQTSGIIQNIKRKARNSEIFHATSNNIQLTKTNYTGE